MDPVGPCWTLLDPLDPVGPCWTLEPYRGELVGGDPLLALGDGVEQEVLQAGQDARLPSPADREQRSGEQEVGSTAQEVDKQGSAEPINHFGKRFGQLKNISFVPKDTRLESGKD